MGPEASLWGGSGCWGRWAQQGQSLPEEEPGPILDACAPAWLSIGHLPVPRGPGQLLSFGLAVGPLSRFCFSFPPFARPGKTLHPLQIHRVGSAPHLLLLPSSLYLESRLGEEWQPGNRPVTTN